MYRSEIYAYTSKGPRKSRNPIWIMRAEDVDVYTRRPTYLTAHRTTEIMVDASVPKSDFVHAPGPFWDWCRRGK